MKNHSSVRRLIIFLSGLIVLSWPCLIKATSPASGTLTPLTTTPLTFAGTAPGTGADSEPDGIEGVNKDTYVLTIAPGAYTNKLVSVTLSWTNPANDRDLYIFKRNADGSNGQAVGESAGGAPQTGEATSFDPSIYGPGDYNVEIIYFASTPATDQPTGTITLINGPSFRTATYTSGGITFSPNTSCKAPTAFSDGEPSSRVDSFGNAYVAGIQGVPAGVDLWYFDLRPTLPDSAHPGQTIPNPNYDPNMRVPLYRGKPDSPSTAAGQAQLQAGALGGGDIDIALGFGSYTGDNGLGLNAQPDPVLAYASLTAANVTVGRSLDRGQTFQFNGVGNFAGGVPVNDRQWMGFVDDHTVYLEYRNFAEGIAFAQQSTDGGLTYGPATLVGTLPQTGACDVDRFDGTVYISGNDGHVAAGTPTAPGVAPTSYNIYQATPMGVNVANIFFPIRVAADQRHYNPDGSYTLVGPGTLYGTYSDGANLYLIHSFDHGQHWSNPVRVNNPVDPQLKQSLFPWLATGPTPGSVGIVWYASDSTVNDDTARWRVYYALSYNATSDTPNFQYGQASDHTNHAANISLSGLVLTGTSPNRNLADYFQVNFDPLGAAQIAYTDDHSDFSGEVFATRQTGGPSINAKVPNAPANVPASAEGSALPAQPFAMPGATPAAMGQPAPQPMQPGPNGEQVTDFAQDQDSGLLATTPTNSPLDIISVKYQSQNTPQGLSLTATMTLSDLTALPPTTTWRMYFAANAPELGIAGPVGNQFSKGLSDRGDQFYIEAATNQQGTVTFNWGTAVRNFSGGIDTTRQGSATSGAVNKLLKQISVRIAVSTLNNHLTSIGHPTIGVGSTLCGLRGNAFQTTSSGIALEDYTRGGTEFTFTSSP